MFLTRCCLPLFMCPLCRTGSLASLATPTTALEGLCHHCAIAIYNSLSLLSQVTLHHCPSSLLCVHAVAHCAQVQWLDLCTVIWGSIQTFLGCFVLFLVISSMAVCWPFLYLFAFIVTYGYLGLHVQGLQTFHLTWLCFCDGMVLFGGPHSGFPQLWCVCIFVSLQARTIDLFISVVLGLGSFCHHGRYCAFRGHLSVPFDTASRCDRLRFRA